MQPIIDALRDTILAAAPGITEIVKWNSPTFCAGTPPKDFATLNLYPRNKPATQVLVILHFGAKKTANEKPNIPDPESLLKWLGPDRASLTFTSVAQVQAQSAALQTLLRHWLQHL